MKSTLSLQITFIKSYLLFFLIYIISVITVKSQSSCIPEVKFPGGRIVFSNDGNQHDIDDIAALPMALALTKAAGLQTHVVHVEHSHHVCNNNPEQHAQMQVSAEGVIDRFNYPSSIVYDFFNESRSSTLNFIREINKSTSENPLWICAAGPMESVWRAINGADKTKLQFVSIINHGVSNGNHADCGPDNSHTLADLNMFEVANGLKIHNLPNQNKRHDGDGLSSSKTNWTWLENHENSDYRWLYMRNQYEDRYDVSDAGLIYWLLTGGPSGGIDKILSGDIKKLLNNPCFPDKEVSDLCVYAEKDGLVIMEAENTKSNYGEWIEKTDNSGFTGSGHLEFTGNSINGGPPTSPLKYTFKVNTSGEYRLMIRCRKRLDGAKEDKSNDGYVRLEGDFDESPRAGDENGDHALKEVLITDTKIYGGSEIGWDWAVKLDAGGQDNKRQPRYILKKGETYTLTLSGRSINWNIDRIVFAHKSLTNRSAQNENLIESECLELLTGSQRLLDSDLHIFPNPSESGIFNLSMVADWEVYSLQGTRVASGNSGLLDISHFSKGIYLVKVNGEMKKILIK